MIYCTLLVNIFILFIVSVHKAQTLNSGPYPGGLALPVTPVYSVRLNNDAGSTPHGPRQMACSSLRSPPWPRSPPLLSVHLHPNTAIIIIIIIFIPAAPSTHHCTNPSPNSPPPPMLTEEKMNHLDSASVSHHGGLQYIPPAKNTCCTINSKNTKPLWKKISLVDIFQQLINLFLQSLQKSCSVFTDEDMMQGWQKARTE